MRRHPGAAAFAGVSVLALVAVAAFGVSLIFQSKLREQTWSFSRARRVKPEERFVGPAPLRRRHAGRRPSVAGRRCRTVECIVAAKHAESDVGGCLRGAPRTATSAARCARFRMVLSLFVALSRSVDRVARRDGQVLARRHAGRPGARKRGRDARRRHAATGGGVGRGRDGRRLSGFQRRWEAIVGRLLRFPLSGLGSRKWASRANVRSALESGPHVPLSRRFTGIDHWERRRPNGQPLAGRRWRGAPPLAGRQQLRGRRRFLTRWKMVRRRLDVD